MLSKFRNLIPGIVLLAAMIFPLALANAQAVSLQEQLAAQYKVAKMGSDSSGWSVVEEGTVLACKKVESKGVPIRLRSRAPRPFRTGRFMRPPTRHLEKLVT